MSHLEAFAKGLALTALMGATFWAMGHYGLTKEPNNPGGWGAFGIMGWSRYFYASRVRS